MLLIFRFRHHLNNFTNALSLPFVGHITENEHYTVETHYHGNNVYHCVVGESIDKSKLPVKYDKCYQLGSRKMNSVEQLQKKLGIRLDARQRNKIRTLIFDQEVNQGDMVEILGSFISLVEDRVRNERGVRQERHIPQPQPQFQEYEFDNDNALFSPPPPTQKTITKRIRSESCVICMDNPSEVIFAECGHESCCEQCAIKVDSCPLCRKKARNLIK